MFALTKKTDYAIIALSHLAQRPREVCTAREIAGRHHVPPALLMNILKRLCQGELIHSTRGVKGGYRLALPATEITLAAIIAAVEGPIHFVQCAGDHALDAPPCDLLPVCPVSRPVRKVHDRLMIFLEQVRLSHISHDHDYAEHGVALSVEGVEMRTETLA